MKIDDLKARRAEINARAEELKNQAVAERRDLSADEEQELKNLLDEFDRVDERVADLERLERQSEAMRASQRQTEPERPGRKALAPDPEGDPDGGDQARPQQARRLANNGPRVYAEPVRERKGGFRSLGDMALAVRSAARPGGVVDNRLAALAPTAYGNEDVGADGGFAVPPDFRAEIMQKVMDEDSLAARCDQIPSASNTLVLPVDETTPWQTTGGIQAYWDGEADQLTQSKPALQNRTVRLNKLQALVGVTEELMEDAAAMDTYLRRKAPEKIGFKLDLAVLQGDGVGKPHGMLGAPCTVSVAKESSQAADTIVGLNVIKMWSRMYARCRRNAVWLVNQDIEPQLLTLMKVGKLDTGAADTGWGVPLYLPANGLSGSPYSTLFNRPVIAHQACETLGDKGDILLVDPTKYILSLRSGLNPKVDVSIHLWFDYNLTAYRFTLRVGGQPWWGAAISPRDGSNTLGCFVTLDERA